MLNFVEFNNYYWFLRYNNSTLVPEAFFYSFSATFATWTTSFTLFLIGTKGWELMMKRKPLVKTVEILTSCHQLLNVVSNWRIFLIALWVIWLDGLNIFGDVIGQGKMTSLTAVKCWARMKVRFLTILTRGFLFSQLGG